MTPDLNVAIDGAGPALVLVNGATCNLHQWDLVIDELAATHTVIRHDVRGTGHSPPGPTEACTFEHYADDIVELCAGLGFARFDLWGMAWGARVALVTAARHPDAVDRLVLSDLAVDPADPEAQRAGALQARQARAAAGVAETPKPAGAFDHDDPEAMARTLAATTAHPDLRPFARQVQAPTLIVTGEFDPNLVSSRAALPHFADAALRQLPLTAHGSVLQRPDIVLAEVTPFLAPEV